MEEPELIERNRTEISLSEVLEAVDKVLPGKRDLVMLALATVISRYLDKKTPLWLMFVGVPASAKTEIVRLLGSNPLVYYLDTLTENAFISGAKNNNGSDPTDLLPILDGKCFVVKDFTTTLSQREETVRKILGDLTSIYDNSFAKHSPQRGTVRYNAFFSFLGCVTPQAINRHQRYMSQIGPRFLFFRVPSSNDEEVLRGLDALWSTVDAAKALEEVQQLVSAYSCQVMTAAMETEVIKEGDEVKRQLNALARFIAQARGMVITRAAEFQNEEGQTVSFYEPIEIQIEEPYRALKQLRVLAKSLAVASGRDEVTPEDIELTRKVAISSMPADRSLLLSVIASEQKNWTAKDVADALGISHKTALRQLDELVSLKILIKSEQGIGLAHLYSVKESFRSVLYGDAEFLSHPTDTETQTPHQESVNTDELIEYGKEIGLF